MESNNEVVGADGVVSESIISETVGGSKGNDNDLVPERILTPEEEYSKKLADYKQQIMEIESETHPGLKNALDLIESDYLQELQRKKEFLEYQLSSINRIYELEKEHYINEYKADYENLQEEMYEALENKKRKLLEDCESLDLNTDIPDYSR